MTQEESKIRIEAFEKALSEMSDEDFNKIVSEIDAMGLGGPTVDEYFDFVCGSPQKIADLTRQLENKDKRIIELLDNGDATAKLIVQYCATIESLRKEITLKDGIISDHAESILELRKENEELKREIESLHKEQAGEDI